MIPATRFTLLLRLQDPIDRHVAHRTRRIHFLRLHLLLLLGATLPLLLDRFPLHAARQTFLVSTVLAPVPLPLVYDAVLLLAARIRKVFAYRPLEEALTALTAVHAIVLAARPVTTYRAQVLRAAQRMVGRVR